MNQHKSLLAPLRWCNLPGDLDQLRPGEVSELEKTEDTLRPLHMDKERPRITTSGALQDVFLL